MSRYLILEVTDEIHDLTDMLEFHRGKRGVVLLGQEEGTDVVELGRGDVLDVRLPARPLAKEVGTIKGTDTVIYVTETRM